MASPGPLAGRCDPSATMPAFMLVADRRTEWFVDPSRRGWSLLLDRRRVVLQQLRDRLVQILFLLLRLRLRIQRLARGAAPHQVLRRRGVHVQRELADVNRGGLTGRHSTAAAVPAAAVPAW